MAETAAISNMVIYSMATKIKFSSKLVAPSDTKYELSTFYKKQQHGLLAIRGILTD